MNFIKNVTLISFLMICNVVNATTLKDSLRAAYKYNPDYLKSIINIELQKEQALSSFSKFMPNLKYENQRNLTKDRSLATKDTNRSLSNRGVSNSLQYNHNLFNGGEDYAKLASDRTLINAQELSSLDVEQQVFLKVIQSHLNVIASQKIVEEYKHNVEYLEKTLRAEQGKFDAGLTKMMDLANTKANLQSGKATLARAISDLEKEQANYKVLTGIDAFELEEPVIATIVEDNLDQIYLQATKTNPALRSSKSAYEAREILSKAAFSVFMPKVSLQASLSRATNTSPLSSLPYSKTRTATALVTIPIFQGGAEYAQYRTTKLQASQSRLEYISALAGTESIVKNAWFQFNSSKVALSAYEEASRASKIALDGMYESYNEGLSSLTELLTTLQNDVNTNINLINSKAAVIVYYYQLKSVIGELTADSLEINEQKN